MAVLSDIKTTEWLLTQWGRWAYVNRGINLYYPGIEPTERMRGGGLPTPTIDDDDAVIIDAAVSGLRSSRAQEYRAVVLYYLCGKSYRQIAKIEHKHHRDIADLVQGGKMWVEGAIRGIDKYH